MNSPLFREVFLARQRVYAVGNPTPLERLEVPGVDAEIWLKREDLSPIHAYKWRGAYNRMAVLSDAERQRGVITCSAGNHAQGVALGAAKLGIRARVIMPVSTPRMKQAAVKRHGGEFVEIVLVGDTFDEAKAIAQAEAAESGAVMVHPYDDPIVMGGQGTIADEVVMSGKGPFDVAFLQIGGGGLAAGVGCWLREYYPGIELIGIEGAGQASMAAAVKAGHPVELEDIDIFCDGTAVRQAGDHTFPECARLIDRFETVTNEEVCAAIQTLWETRRCIPEPAGAMGLAGLMKRRREMAGKRVLVLLCGGNMDFGRLAWIARHAGIGAARRRYYRFEIGEESGTMLNLLETVLEGINIIEFQYGKTHPERAWPVIGFEASPPELDLLDQRLTEFGVEHEDVTSKEDVEFRIIPYDPALFRLPYFICFDFPERAGALHDFLDRVRGLGNLCYFNYVFTGEEVGRALLGIEFDSEEQRSRFQQTLRASHFRFREIDRRVLDRVF